MKEFIKNRFKELIKEEVIDGQEMNPHLASLCNTMSVKSYNEVVGRIIAAIGPKDKNPELWGKIEKPLSMLEKANFDINKQKGMSGDSMVDESNTWWSAIQTTLCEQGSDFQ